MRTHVVGRAGAWGAAALLLSAALVFFLGAAAPRASAEGAAANAGEAAPGAEEPAAAGPAAPAAPAAAAQEPGERRAQAPAAQAQAPPRAAAGGTGTANPVVLVIVLGALALAPFALIMLTSFVKISVVLSILRNALGAQQVPPNQVITGISLILTVFIMAPVVEKMYAEAGQIGDSEAIFSEVSVKTIFEGAKRGREPLRVFLERHAAERDRKMFYDLARRMAVKNGNDPAEILVTDFRIVVPAFVTSQLTEAFKIGFLLFIPFLIIDMVVSNILQAMGMFMLSPTMISLPFKLLLFVLVDGWVILIRNLVLAYT
ncbi:MAG TPA: type III secretion system export apparatus subunit SctR [Pyrinomonadaceae bacterium]|nr:type III secretion system export apparatus subunit SctR [Pyrinomonadaceae bacterium]